MAKSFEESVIWQDARKLANLVHFTFFTLKDFDFKNQINCAAVSDMNNTAEGFERYSQADFKHFLQIAKASNGEVRSMTYLAEDYSYLTNEKAIEIRNLNLKIKTEIASMINTLTS